MCFIIILVISEEPIEMKRVFFLYSILLIGVLSFSFTLKSSFAAETKKATTPSMATTEDWKNCQKAHEKVCPRQKHGGLGGQIECLKKSLDKLPKLCATKFKEGYIEIRKYQKELAEKQKKYGDTEYSKQVLEEHGVSPDSQTETPAPETAENQPKNSSIEKTESKHAKTAQEPPEKVSQKAGSDVEEGGGLSRGKMFVIIIIVLGLGTLMFLRSKR